MIGSGNKLKTLYNSLNFKTQFNFFKTFFLRILLIDGF